MQLSRLGLRLNYRRHGLWKSVLGSRLQKHTTPARVPSKHARKNARRGSVFQPRTQKGFRQSVASILITSSSSYVNEMSKLGVMIPFCKMTVCNLDSKSSRVPISLTVCFLPSDLKLQNQPFLKCLCLKSSFIGLSKLGQQILFMAFSDSCSISQIGLSNMGSKSATS